MTTLDEATIRELLDAIAIKNVEKLEVFPRIDSTNSYLRDRTAPGRGSFRVALADHQTAGRGRNQNRWVSAPGRSLCLSLAHTFERTPANLSALALALGVGAIEVLRSLGIGDVGLKWPNDLVAADAKLGGILVETQVRRRNEAVVVAGIGLNVNLPDRMDDDVDPTATLRAIDLCSLALRPPARETLAAAMIQGWQRTILEYEAGGFERFIGRYESVDWLAGRAITVATAELRVTGTAAGISETGALLVETRSGIVPVVSGTILSVEAG
jgi:BirA family biotin operon repressor/biotin-[acetyl-CoA-carboxylase] ligase